MNAIYTRQSVDKKDSISIESQIDFCKRECVDEDYKVYSDKGYSGSNTNRPDFENLIRDIERGLIKKVIVYRLDRISRSLLDFSQIIEYFNKFGVEFVSCTEKFDTSTPIGRAMLSIIMVFAQLERETIQMRIRDNYYARGKKGFYMGGRAPFGFNKIDIVTDGKKTCTFEENPIQIETLKYMFEEYAYTTQSLGQISSKLNDGAVPPPEGKYWDSCKLSRIMRNPVYVAANIDIYNYYKGRGCILTNEISDYVGYNGCYLYGKRQSNERKYTNVKDHCVSLALHKGVIDARTFLKCQYKMDNNKQIRNSGKGKYTWMSGLMKCGYCGYAMTVTKAKNTNYINCRGRSVYKACDGHTSVFRVDEVEPVVEQQFFRMLESVKISKCIHSNDTIQENDYKIQIEQIEEKINNLISQLEDGNKTLTKYVNLRLEELEQQKQKLQDEYQKIKLSKSDDEDGVINALNEWQTMDLEQKKEVARHFIEKINFTDEKIEIVWKQDFNAHKE